MNDFKQFFGGPYDPSLRYPATATSIAEIWPSNDTDVNHAKDLQALANQSAVRYVHLNVGNGGIYELYAPLDLNHPISLLADPGVQLRFHLVDDTSANGLAWRNSAGAIRVNASHVGLNGFQVRFAGTMADWNYAASGKDNDNRAVIQMAGTDSQIDVSIVALDVEAPSPGSQQPSNLRAIDILKADTLDSGRINNSKFVGGPIELRGGPWEVLSNDYQGPPARTFSPVFVSAWTAHDLVIRANHAHLKDPDRMLSGAGDRFFVLKDQGWGNLIQGNLVDGGYGQPTGATYSDPTKGRNAPENILTESYSPHYEGWSSISNGGQVLQIGDLRGARPSAGSVVAVLSGASQGQWRQIAQRIDDHTYLLDQPLSADETRIVSITGGSVGLEVHGNKFDLSKYRSDGTILTGVDQADNGIQLAGNDYGCQVVDNRFVGAIPFYIHCQTTNNDGTTDTTAPGPYGTNSAPEKWTRGPILGLVMTGNTFEFESGASPTSVLTMEQASDRAYTSGRVYLSGTVSDNSFQYKSTPTAAAFRIGTAGYGGPSNADPTSVNVAAIGNWVGGGHGNTTVQVYAGRVYYLYANQGAPFTLVDQTYNLQATDPNDDSSQGVFGIPFGLDALDYAGSQPDILGRPGFDQYQDYHIRVYGLRAPNRETGLPIITFIEVRPLNEGVWTTSPGSGTLMAYKYEVARPSYTADLYFQPDHDYDGPKGFEIKVHCSDNQEQGCFVNGVICNATTPTPPRTALGGKPGPYSGVLSGDFSGEYGGGGPNPIDSDGRADFAIYRAKSTEFITLDSTLADSVLSDPGPSNLGGQVLGLWGDIPVPANYGGVDKKSDFAVFRPWTNQFIYLDSSTGRVVFQYLGYGGDVPVS